MLLSINMVMSVDIMYIDRFDYNSVGDSAWVKTGVGDIGLIDIELTINCGSVNESNYSCFSLTQTVASAQTIITKSFDVTHYGNIRLDIRLSTLLMSQLISTEYGFIQYKCDNGVVVEQNQVRSVLYASQVVSMDVNCSNETKQLGIEIGLHQTTAAFLYVDDLVIVGDIVCLRLSIYVHSVSE